MPPAINLDRAHLYRFLARTFQFPERSLLDRIRDEDLPDLGAALARLGGDAESVTLCKRLRDLIVDTKAAELEHAYMKTFEPAGGAERPPNETAHAPQTPQEGLTRNFELADIAGFYRAFGVEVTPGSERVDHIAAELEFLHLLAVKAAHAEHCGDSENAEICRDASAAFLRDHLARWCSRLSAWLDVNACADSYRLAGKVLASFVKLDAALMSTP
jgi:putative dimethyl sulfoxide reductase chaperone